MRRILMRLVREEGGFVSGPEWAFVATILVLGAITGVMLTRQSAEGDLAPSVSAPAAR